MKARIPKSWETLPEAEKHRLAEFIDGEVYKRCDYNYANLQEIWIKMTCGILHDCFGFDEEQLLIYLGNYKRVYRQLGKTGSTEANIKLVTDKCNTFFSNGFPQEYLDRLKEM